MEQELLTKLEDANLPGELRDALAELIRAAPLLNSGLPAWQARRNGGGLERIVTEVIDPDVEPRWWEVRLDLLAKSARERGAAGERVTAAIGRLAPLLRKRMPTGGEVSLEPITEDTVGGVCLMSDTLSEPGRSMVATNAVSLAQAHFNKHAWFRAIHAGKTPVGFMMIVDDDETPEYFLWRLMIAEPYQGRGFGRLAMERLVAYVRTRPGARELVASCGEGEGSPLAFYLKLGFVPGEMDDDERVLRLALL